MSSWHLNLATRIILGGGVIAYPTEAVYGLGCLPHDYFAVARILNLKNRPVKKGLILVAANIEQLAGYIEFPHETVRQRVLSTWPGPVTWVLPARPEVPIWLRGQHNTIAARGSKNEGVRSQCEKKKGGSGSSRKKRGAVGDTEGQPRKPATGKISIESPDLFWTVT